MKITTVILLYTILVALIGSSIQMQEENDEYGSSQEVPQCNCVLRAQQRDCVEKVSVPHYIAFGQTSQHIDSCYRKYSKINERVCYRKTTTQCNIDGQLQVKCLVTKRDPAKDKVLNQCNHHSNTLDFLPSESDGVMYISSPRYSCEKINKKKVGHWNYRNQEMCMYNVSMPCDSGRVHFHFMHIDLQPPITAGNRSLCYNDYIQISDENLSESFCGDDQESTNIILNNDMHFQANFSVLFWTDHLMSDFTGFQVRASCVT